MARTVCTPLKDNEPLPAATLNVAGTHTITIQTENANRIAGAPELWRLLAPTASSSSMPARARETTMRATVGQLAASPAVSSRSLEPHTAAVHSPARTRVGATYR